MEALHVKDSVPQNIFHYSQPFPKYSRSKLKSRPTFLGIKSIDLTTPSFHEAVCFHNLHPLFKLQVASSSRLKVIGENLFFKLLDLKILQPKIAKNV